MNEARRLIITEAVEALDALKTKVEAVHDQEQAAHNAMPDAWQRGEWGQEALASLNALSDGLTAIESAVESLNEANEL